MISVSEQGQFDPDIPKFYLLLHDKCSTVRDSTTALLKEMRARLSPSACFARCINSISTDSPEMQHKLWPEDGLDSLYDARVCLKFGFTLQWVPVV